MSSSCREISAGLGAGGWGGAAALPVGRSLSLLSSTSFASSAAGLYWVFLMVGVALPLLLSEVPWSWGGMEGWVPWVFVATEVSGPPFTVEAAWVS